MTIPTEKADVVLVDDHPVVLAGLCETLHRQPDLRVLASLTSPQALLSFLENREAHLVVLDLNLGRKDGFELIKTLKVMHPAVRILVFSMHEEDTYARRCLLAGASGYVMKGSPADTLLGAIRTVLKGAIFLSEGMLEGNLPGDPAAKKRGIAGLTDRELVVFDLVGRGLGTREMAAALHLSIKTVETHRENIKRKLGITSIEKLISEAARWNERGNQTAA